MLSGAHVHQIPITKSQIPNNIQFSNSNHQKVWGFLKNFGHWDFGNYLIIGAWDLVLHHS
jgi:hypothetical protein